jgi:type II secretory pathway pseudopilin PulG
MNLRCSENRNQAMTLFEVIIVLIILVFLAYALLPALMSPPHRRHNSCSNGLKQMALASFVRAGDNNDKFPMAVSVTNGGAMESANAGDAAAVFQAMSNELSTAKILWCPADDERNYATNWTSDFSARHISYFIGLDAIQGDPQSVLSGDDNFQFAGNAINPGLRMMSTNVFYTWNTNRHHLMGNIAMGDGSVQVLTNPGLTNQIWQTNFSVLRLAVP